MPGFPAPLISLPNELELTSIDILPFIADSVICTDGNGRILLFNPAAEGTFGYSVAEILGENVNKLLPQRHRVHHADQMRAFSLEQGIANRFMGDRREVRGLRKSGKEFPAEATVSRHSLNNKIILTVVLRDITERKELENQREAIAHELDHRIKNVISVVSALVSLTAKSALSVTEFRDSLQQRLGSLAATQTLLAQGEGKKLDLKALLGAELEHYHTAGRDNLRIEGPAFALRSSAVQSLALVIHELATNSAKYGAISEPGGCVTITTEFTGASITRQLVIEWRETGGPSVKAPDRRGFGTHLIQQMIERVFHGSVAFDYQPEGLICRMVMPAGGLEEIEAGNAIAVTT